MESCTVRRLILLLGVALLAGVSTVALAQGLDSTPEEAAYQLERKNVELIGQIGGASYAVAIRGDYAYVGFGPRVLAFDISTPTSVTVVGQTDVFPDTVQGLALAGGHAYVANEEGGLRIIDISSPANPVEVGVADSGRARDVVVSSTLAYVADVVRAVLAATAGSASGTVVHLGEPTPTLMAELVANLAAAGGLRARTVSVPGWVLKGAGKVGDLLQFLGFRSIAMTSDKAAELLACHWSARTAESLAALGLGGFVPFMEGAAETWMDSAHSSGGPPPHSSGLQGRPPALPPGRPGAGATGSS